MACRFVKFMSDTLAEMSALLDTEGASFFIFQQGERLQDNESYVRVIFIDGLFFSLGLIPDYSDDWLLQTAANVVADCLQEKNVDLSLKSDWFVRQDIAAPFEPGTMARELLLRVYQYILHHFHGIYNLQLDNFNSLSYFPYEGESAGGTLCVAPTLTQQDQASIEKLLGLAFEPPLPVFTESNLRQIRKLLSGAGENALFLAPIIDPDKPHSRTFGCYGYLPKEKIGEAPYHVCISGPGTWDFYVECRRLFRYGSGQLKLWKDPLADAIRDLREELGVAEAKSRPLLEALSKQKHGTSVIFFRESTNAEVQINRLAKHKRSFPIKDLAITEESIYTQLSGLTRMDGALIVEAGQWAVKYIATIVDGRAVINADLSRGARHNSVSTFIANLRQDDTDAHAVAVIFSEDGGAQSIRASQIQLQG